MTIFSVLCHHPSSVPLDACRCVHGFRLIEKCIYDDDSTPEGGMKNVSRYSWTLSPCTNTSPLSLIDTRICSEFSNNDAADVRQPVYDKSIRKSLDTGMD